VCDLGLTDTKAMVSFTAILLPTSLYMVLFWKIMAAGLSAFLLWAAFPPMGEAVDIVFALASIASEGGRRLVVRLWLRLLVRHARLDARHLQE